MTRPFTIHVGVKDEDAENIPAFWDTSINGDSWEVWGETDRTNICHVQIHTHNWEDMVEVLSTDPFLPFLQPFADHWYAGEVLVVTPADDWSNVLAAFIIEDGTLVRSSLTPPSE